MIELDFWKIGLDFTNGLQLRHAVLPVWVIHVTMVQPAP